MCLTAHKNHTDKLKAKKGKVKAYKVYVIDDVERTVVPPYFDKGGEITRPGVIKSNRPKNAKVNWRSFGNDSIADVEKGIHVYLKRSDAVNEAEYHDDLDVFIFQVEADYADLVAAASPYDSSQAVFTKILLTEKAWDKAFPPTAKEKAARRKRDSRNAKRRAARRAKKA